MADISALALKVESSGVVKASEDLDRMSKSAREAASQSSELNGAFEGLNMQSLTAAAGVGALTLATTKLINSLIDAGKASIQMYSHFEQVKTGLSTILQDTEKGSALFEDLRKFSFETTFGVDELADASTQLLNAGTSVDKLQGKLKMLGDLAGGSKQKFAELVSIMGKIDMTGRAGAIQLQQLALRGIPIKQVLADMGVTGVASAEQINAAFEKLTATGGQFHNAMSNIIGTIEGKEGFITDTMKEISVNFAEASGLADAYKAALDLVYSVVEQINNALAAINDNPAAKAIFQGVLVAGIGALAGIIAAALIPVLTVAVSLFASLAAAAAPFVAVGAAVGLLGLAFVKAVEHGKELTKEIDELNERKAELYKKNEEGTSTFEEQIELQKIQLELAKKQREEVIKRNEAVGESYGDEYFDYDSYDEAQAAYEIEKAKYDEMLKQKEMMEYFAKLYKNVISEAERLRQITEDSNNSYKTALEMAEKFYKQTKEGRIEALKAQAMMTQNAIYGKLEERTTKDGLKYIVQVAPEGKEKQKLEAFLNHIREEIKKAENEGSTTAKLKIESTDLDKAMETFNTAVKNRALGIGSIGDINNSKITLLQEQIKNAYKEKQNAMSNGDTSEADFQDQLLASYQAEYEELVKQADVWGTIQEKMSGAFQEMGFGADVANKFAGTLTNIASTTIPNGLVSGFQSIGKAMNEGADGGDAFKQAMAQLTQQMLQQISSTAIQAGLMLIAQGGIAMLGPGLALIALGAGGAIASGIMGGNNSSASNAAKEQEELLKRLNEQYKDLYEALQEEQEYYLKKRRQINSGAVNANAGMTSVNDMIITPEGNFSTSPKDYLIATKHPESLVGGNMNMSVTINNTMGDDANVTATQTTDENGQQQLVVMISKKVAQDYAEGKNGWDSAIDANSARRRGRSYA